MSPAERLLGRSDVPQRATTRRQLLIFSPTCSKSVGNIWGRGFQRALKELGCDGNILGNRGPSGALWKIPSARSAHSLERAMPEASPHIDQADSTYKAVCRLTFELCALRCQALHAMALLFNSPGLDSRQETLGVLFPATILPCLFRSSDTSPASMLLNWLETTRGPDCSRSSFTGCLEARSTQKKKWTAQRCIQTTALQCCFRTPGRPIGSEEQYHGHAASSVKCIRTAFFGFQSAGALVFDAGLYGWLGLVRRWLRLQLWSGPCPGHHCMYHTPFRFVL